jgi:anti-sigma-K factor RskA
MNHSGFDPTCFDDALRQRHAAAISHLSARTQAQLRNRLAASGAAPRHFVRHRLAWAAATACATLFALVIGLQLRPQSMPATSPATVAVDDSQADASTTYAVLDENPDLYLWLASKDAVALASE